MSGIVEEAFPSVLDAKNVCVCVEVLGKKMASLDQQEVTIRHHNYDGSDSGVDISATKTGCLRRDISTTSGGYASSNGGGLDESNKINNVSCDSSMISYSSDVCEIKMTNIAVHSQNSNDECCSENGSESSSVNAELVSNRKVVANLKKKVALFEPIMSVKKSPPIIIDHLTDSITAGQLNKTRSKVAPSQTRPSSQPMPRNCGRARSRDKNEKNSSVSSSKTTTPPNRCTPVRQKPDSLPSVFSTTPNVQRLVHHNRTRTPGTPSDDGRWPSVGGRGLNGVMSKRGTSVTPDLTMFKQRQMLTLDSKYPATANLYGTLPRRKKQKSVEDLTRENRMVSSVVMPPRKSLVAAFATYRESVTSQNQQPSLTSSMTSKCNRKAVIPKTTIYHETSAQTAITSQDVERALAGSVRVISIDAIEHAEKETQSDIRDREIERLQDEIRRFADTEATLTAKLKEKAQIISNMEVQLTKEREDNFSLQRELHLNTERVLGMLELARGTPTEGGQCDSLLMLESQIQMSGHELIEKQEEIGKLRKLCRTLQNEMDRSLLAQERLIQEKTTVEKESNELQDFLQQEKIALCDALKEIELEYQSCKKMLDEKNGEIKVLRDECRHLVRLNEQRRQENKMMQSKYSVLEGKSKELIVQQNTSISGAQMALSGLHTRLHSLVEQLIVSYNISEQDLEDIVFHNEAYTNSGSSYDGTPECENPIFAAYDQHQQSEGSLSPQRNQSFIAAVISAIRNATTQSGKKLRSRSKKLQQSDGGANNGEESDSTEMLDSETEPCLMMDNVLEDVAVPDSHSHNMVSSTGIISQIEIPSELFNSGDDSLHNLSEAITNRQQIELQINSMSVHNVAVQLSQRENSVSDDSCQDFMVEFSSAQAVVNQVIEVDNLVTKLLKVLRLIQMDNDSCIQQLILDKNKLQQNKEDMLEKIKNLQDMNIKLQDELMDATQELMIKGSDLSSTKSEMQRHRNEIDRLTEDICNLSTLCSSQTQSQQKYISILPESCDILSLLNIWHQQGYLYERNIRDFMKIICQEETLTKIPEQNQNVRSVLSDNFLKPHSRQYEHIGHVLDILGNLKCVVEDTPELQKLQHDLKQINIESTQSFSLRTLISAATTVGVTSNTKCSPQAKAIEDIDSIEDDTNANGSPIENLDSTKNH